MNFEVKNGCFGYKKKQILNDISFSVNDGEVMSVLGSNGVGKTTLIKCMIGLLKWKSGCSELDGTNISAPQGAVAEDSICATGKGFGIFLQRNRHGNSWQKRTSGHIFPARQRGQGCRRKGNGGHGHNISSRQALQRNERRRASDGAYRKGADH